MKIKVGVIGLGYWGPNYLRNFTRYEQYEVVYICDSNIQKLKAVSKIYPYIKAVDNYKEMLNAKTLDLVAIATPPSTHYEIAKNCLNSGRHVLIAKPMATSSIKVMELLKIAKREKLLLHGDLTFLYNPEIREIKNTIKKGQIGKPLYYDSTRTNLGLIQQNVNVLWDLAIHDLSILDYCFGFKPKSVFAVASKHIKNSQMFEMAHITINYANNFIAHIHVSWLSPVKIRTILIGGTQKMIAYDDVDPDEKIKIYSKGVEIQSDKITPFKPMYRSGEIVIPKVDNEESLFVEVKELSSLILKKKFDYSNALINVKTLKILEACDKSIKQNSIVNL